jgi:S-adenosylmethionine:tRNA ribosyltransferase-isomerase
MDVRLFDFDLPEKLIALRPVSPRDHARMLVVRPGAPLADRHMFDLPAALRAGDVLVVNDTRVIPARLFGLRVRAGTQARVEILLHQRLDGSQWLAFARPAKKLHVGDHIQFAAPDTDIPPLSAQVLARGEAGEVTLQFNRSGPALDSAIFATGELPLPPYIAGKRKVDGADTADYQTMFAKDAGAVAAPTAGLHFTPELLAKLAAAGIGVETVTLHVGAGTFLPVKADDTDDHKMHAEWGAVSASTAQLLNSARAAGGRIIAVGTTSLRLLESAAAADGSAVEWSGTTEIFITPGYRFRAVDALVTNFHLPKSTLFMLVSAFCGLDTMQAAYAHAIAAEYRFYSYGDGSLLFRR